MGANLVAISPIEKRYARKMVEKLGLEFPLLGDPGNAVASAFGLKISVPAPLRAVYLSFGIDLERVNGPAGWSLPLASRYVIGRDGVVVAAQTNIDHTHRQEPTETLAVLRRLEAW